MNKLIQLCRTSSTSEKAYFFSIFYVLEERQSQIRKMYNNALCIIIYMFRVSIIVFVYTSVYTRIFLNHIFYIIKMCNFFVCVPTFICFC